MKKILQIDPYLVPYAADIDQRVELFKKKKKKLLAKEETLSDFANGYEYYGIHPTENGRQLLPIFRQMVYWDEQCQQVSGEIRGVEKGNITLMLNTEATDLITDATGRVTGVKAIDEAGNEFEIDAEITILATGGYLECSDYWVLRQILTHHITNLLQSSFTLLHLCKGYIE